MRFVRLTTASLALAVLAEGCQRQEPATENAAEEAGPAKGLVRGNAGQPAPDIELRNADDDPATLAEAEGKPLLVNIWATWCAPCVKELPTLQAIAARAGAPRVIAVSQDMAPRGSVDAFLDKNKLADLEVWHDPKMALSSATGAEVIDQLHDDVHRLAVAYPQQPLSHILADLVDTQDTIFTLLEQRQRPQHARQMYFLGSVVGGMLAKASHDLSEPHAAMAQARTAYLCADNADHDGLRAWLRGLQSLVSYWARRPQEAVRYAQSGGDFALRAGNTTAVWLPMNEARA